MNGVKAVDGSTGDDVVPIESFANPDWYKGSSEGQLNWGESPEWHITGRVDGNPGYLPHVNKQGYTTDSNENVLSGQPDILLPIDITATDILKFVLSEQTRAAEINTTNKTVDIEVKYGTDLNSLDTTFTLSSGASANIGSTPQVSGTTTNDFENPVTYTITADDGTTAEGWIVKVTVAAPEIGADLIGLTISTGNISPKFDKNKTEYTSPSVSYGVSQTTVTPTTSSIKSTMIMTINGESIDSVDSGVAKTVGLRSGRNTIAITVTAEDNSKKKYTIIVYRQATPSYDSQKSKEYETRLIGKRMITSEEFKSWDEHKDTPQPIDKVWSVKFNALIDKKTAIIGDDYITVVDEDGYRIAIQLEYDEATNILKIIPLNDYKTGKKYYLILGKKVRNAKRTDLKTPVRVEFMIEN